MKHRTVYLLLAAVGIVALAGVVPVVGQQIQVTEEVVVRVINLEAVVTDRDGIRVPDLSRGDFVLYVDGEEVGIDYFTEIREGNVIDSASGVPDLSGVPNVGANFLIFIDEFFPIGRDKEQVLRAIAERIGDNMEANDRIAIVAWNGEGIETTIDWTSSVDEASAAMEVALERESFGLRREQERRRFLQDRDDFATMSAARSSRAGADPFGDPMGGRSNDRYGRATSSWDRQWRLGTQERAYAQMLAGQIQGAVGAASASMRALEAPPGRNVLVLLSGGWPWNPSQYASGTGSRMLDEPLVSEGLEIYGPIAETANLMGYTIYGIDVPGMQMGRGFDPTVGGTSPGMGSLGGSSDQFLLEMEIHDSLQFMAQETGGLALINAQRIDALDEIGEVERKGRREITVPVTVSIPLSRMSLQPGEDGTLVAQLALIMVALDDEGGRIDIPAQQLVLTVTGEPRADTMARYETTIELRRRDYNLAIAVVDFHSETTLTRAVRIEAR